MSFSEKKKELSQYELMAETPVPRLLLHLAVPSVITMLITNIYNLVDTAFVGQLGTSASGAVGIVFGFMSILQAFAFMFGQGSGIQLSHCLGRKDNTSANVLAMGGLSFSFLTGLLLSILGLIFLEPLVYLLGSTDTIAPYAKTYITFILLAAPFTTASFTMNNLLRYEGKARLGMIGMMTGAILNIAGDPIFMFGMKMGIAGAGLSTALSQCISFIILLSMFLRKKTEIRLSAKNIPVSFRRFAGICATGSPSLLRQGLMSLSSMILNNCASDFGDAAVAGMSIVARIAAFIMCLSIGIGQGFQPISAFSYGAGKYARLRQGYRVTLLSSEIITLTACIPVFIFAASLIALFRDDPEVISIGTRALRLNTAALLAVPACMASEMQLQCTGQKLKTLFLSALRNGLCFIPLLLILTPLRGLAGIQEAQPLAHVLAFLPTMIIIRKFFRALPKEDK